jgi:tRNA U34 5-carboxymethylaminomethyl modifying enzyme MnmG/GidA
MMLNACIYCVLRLEVFCITNENQMKLIASKNSISSSEQLKVKNIENRIHQFNKENFLNETHLTDKQPQFLKKKEIMKVLRKVEAKEILKNPTIKIDTIDTHILIKKDKTEGEVFEKVKFSLRDGVFNSIVRKISLGGTSDKHFGFRLASA